MPQAPSRRHGPEGYCIPEGRTLKAKRRAGIPARRFLHFFCSHSFRGFSSS